MTRYELATTRDLKEATDNYLRDRLHNSKSCALCRLANELWRINLFRGNRCDYCIAYVGWDYKCYQVWWYKILENKEKTRKQKITAAKQMIEDIKLGIAIFEYYLEQGSVLPNAVSLEEQWEVQELMSRR